MIVFITIPWFLPAYKAGGPIQSVVNLINNFTENVEYYIFCGDEDLNGEPLENIVKGEWVDYNGHTKIWYAPKEDLSNTLATQIETIKPEVLYIIGLFDWHFNIVPLLFAKANRKIISVRGMLHPGALTQKKWKKRFFLQALKIFNISSKVIFHATDNTEEGFIKNEFGANASVLVAGNFARIMKKNVPFEKNPGSLNMVTIALISPMKNHLQTLKALMWCEGNICYNIYGPLKDASYWNECIEQMSLLPSNIKVHYHEELLPDEVETVLTENHLFIMPSKSENFGHAIAEALGAGKPVITSHATPWNELQQNGAGANVEPNVEELAAAINEFTVLNNEEYIKCTDNVSAYYKSKLDLDEMMNAYKKLFLIPSN